MNKYLFFNSLKVQYKEGMSAISNKVLEMDAVFLGTKGVEKSPVGHKTVKGKSYSFCRFGINNYSSKSLANEGYAVSSIQRELRNQVPSVLKFHRQYAELTSVSHLKNKLV